MTGTAPITHSEKLQLLEEYSAKPLTAYLSEREVAVVLGCSPRKLQKDRGQGTGIPYIKQGRAVRYRKSSVEKHMGAKTEFVCTREAAFA